MFEPSFEAFEPAYAAGTPVLVSTRLVADLEKAGKPAFHEPSADKIIAKLRPPLQEGDVLVVLSNGAVDGLHAKLLTALA